MLLKKLALISLFVITHSSISTISLFAAPQICIDAFNIQGNPSYSWSKVVEMYTQCLNNDLNDTERSIALYNRGNVFVENGDINSAINDYNEAIYINPSYFSAYSNRGSARYYNGELDRALADYNMAISLNPYEPVIYASRGATREAKGDIAGALEDYNMAIKLNPNYAEVYGRRAFLYKALGDIEKAKADARKAKALDSRVIVPIFSSPPNAP